MLFFRFFTFGQVKGNPRHGKVNLATEKVATTQKVAIDTPLMAMARTVRRQTHLLSFLVRSEGNSKDSISANSSTAQAISTQALQVVVLVHESRLVCVLLRRDCGCLDSFCRGVPSGSVNNLGCRQNGGDYREPVSARAVFYWVAELRRTSN